MIAEQKVRAACTSFEHGLLSQSDREPAGAAAGVAACALPVEPGDCGAHGLSQQADGGGARPDNNAIQRRMAGEELAPEMTKGD